jgi:hypothetical protein
MIKKFIDWFAEHGFDAVSHVGWIVGAATLIWVIFLIATKSRGVIIQ